jgi:hypothetical protein
MEFSGVTALTMNLAEESVLTVHVKAIDPVDADVRAESHELDTELRAGQIGLSTVPTHLKLRAGESADIAMHVTVSSLAPSFEEKTLTVAALERGELAASADRTLSVKAVYVVKILDGDPFNFDSPDSTLKFAPHAEGLQFLFQNFSSKACVIHGEGAIEHQDTEAPLPPALRGANGQAQLDPRGTYTPALILPNAGDDIASSYTIHDVYHPTRNVIVNARQK